jgi:DNA-binding CsgD family transcriptional regulator
VKTRDPGRFDGLSRDCTAGRPLTTRQLQILRWVATGLNQRAVARRLHITEATVSTMLGRVRAKLDTETTVGAVIKARKMGLIE